MSKEKDLYEFLVEADLQHYYDTFRSNLKVHTVQHLKYVEMEDLADMGMTKPEIRRMKKYYKKECPNSAFGKIKWILSYRAVSGDFSQPSSPPPASPASHRTQAKHIIPYSAISMHKTLGSGEFGTVQQGVWTSEDGERFQVAVKCLSKQKIQGGTSDFLKEASIMHSIDHEHVVRLYGVVFEADALWLVTELAPLRSVLECVKEPSMRINLPIPVLCDFTVQIADGMSYLEKNRLIHRDLAARNILVFAKDKVKVSDFGLSRALGVGEEYYQTNFTTSLKLPIAWCAPESINYLRFTSASDVWAYGVTIWEMLSYGYQPWAAFTGQKACDITDVDGLQVDSHQLSVEATQKILEAIDAPNHQRLEQPSCCPKEFYAIMLKCWEHDPKRRPKFSDLVTILPHIKPEQVQAVHDFPNPTAQKQCLYYRASDIITVLDKKPENPPESNMWKGILNSSNSGKTGYFDPSNTAPFIELNTASPRHTGKSKMVRKDSGRKSLKNSSSAKKISRDMISRPQNDLRHTGHIGYDGAVFGDVAFIGDNYDKLPVKVVTPYKPQDDLNGSMSSLGRGDFDKSDKSHGLGSGHSELSLTSGKSHLNGSVSGMGSPFASDSPSGSGTLTDGSSNKGEADSLGDFTLDLNDDFDSFKMPDFSTSLDLGSSFMDEVMKALNENKEDDNEDSKDKPSLLASSPQQRDTLLSDKTDFRSPAVSISPSSSPPKTFRSLTPSSSPPKSYTIHAPSDEKEKKHKTKLKLDSDEEVEGCHDTVALILDQQHDADEDEEIHPNNSESKKQAKVKPMSASDEKKIDRAIEKANQFAQLNTHDISSPVSPVTVETPKSSHETSDLESSYGSPKLRNIFSFKKNKSPKQEKRSFSDEIPDVADINQDLTPEAQEAYNMLVVRGSTKHSAPKCHPSTPPPPPPVAKQRSPKQPIREPSPVVTPEPQQPSPVKQSDEEQEASDTTSIRSVSPKEPTRHSRERRMRRSLEHHNVSHESIIAAITDQQKNGQAKNLNLREPQGIPGRNVAPKASTEDAEPQEYNPLRRLRESQVVISRSRVSRTEAQNGLSRNEKIRRPNLHPQLPRFHDRQTESVTSRRGAGVGAQIGVAEPQRRLPQGEDADQESSEDSTSVNSLPLPPRGPVRPGSLHKKPRERKYPLKIDTDMDIVSSGGRSSNPDHSDMCGDNNNSVQSPVVSTKSTSDGMLKHDECCDSNNVFRGRNINNNHSAETKSKYCIENVKSSAQELGISDHSDIFWTRNVNFAENLSLDDLDPQSMLDECKFSENVSYEDLLEFALEHDDQTDGKQICDDIKIMQRVFWEQVSVQTCLDALDETSCCVNSAIKLLKLKQLLSTQLADADACKRALLMCHYDVTEAANFIFTSPPSQISPDCVDV